MSSNMERGMMRRRMKDLAADNARLSEQCQKLTSLNAQIMQQALMTSSCMVWLHGKTPGVLRLSKQKTMTIPKDVIANEAPLLKIAAETLKNGDRKFTVTKMTEEEVEQIRQERLAKLHGTEDSGPKIIIPK